MDLEQLNIELAATFVKYGKKIITAYLFGSTAEDVASSSSDIDIALLLHNNDKTSEFELKFSLYADICRASL